LTYLIELLKGLKEHDIEFISLTEQIDTMTPGGQTNLPSDGSARRI
jgi:DNA invertase Pin-like site-specific DNA recombinase